MRDILTPILITLTYHQMHFEKFLERVERMSKILFSINPEHVENILQGTKKVEYRKIRCRRDDIDTVLIYSTSPVKRVVAQAKLLGILEDKPDSIWRETKLVSGITHEFFEKYFAHRDTAVAYELGGVEEFPIPKMLREFGIGAAPQSFVYID